MKKKEFLIIYSIVLLFGIFLCLSIFPGENNSRIDTVYVNELVRQTELNWGQITEETYSKVNFNYTVIDLSGKIVYSTINQKSTTYLEKINEAIAEHDTIVDIMTEDKMLGKLIIKNDITATISENKKRLERSVFIVFLFLVLLLPGYFIYLEIKVFRPFRTLTQFASRISSGNLDTPITMDKKNIFGVFTESFDLMRDALKTARQNEFLANKSKKELVASLSHDIKNPVASIKAICETMALTCEDRHLITIHQKADQIDSLISDMFQATLEELGELKVKAEEYSSEILPELIENSNYYNKVQILTSLPECLILCDKLRLTQVIDNVLCNSYKYAGSDIHISYVRNDCSLQISIKDFGNGIPDAELPFVWEKFYRGANAEGKEGAGLGLYLSKLFLEKMGGQIECLNEVDGFVMKLELRLVGTNL